MRTQLIVAAGVAALAAGGAATAQNRNLPERNVNPLTAPENTGTLQTNRVQPVEPYQTGTYNDVVIRQVDGGRCFVRYVAINTDTGGYRYGDAVETPCSLSVAEAVIEEREGPTGGVVTLSELQASAGVGPLARAQGRAVPLAGARTGQGVAVAGTVPERQYGYMPLRWDGTWAEWREHQDLCDDRYRTYDRTNDMFYAYPGQRHFCNLGLRSPQ